MTTLFEHGALISVPAREQARIEPPSSVYGWGSLPTERLSAPLQRALAGVSILFPEGAPKLFVARPEMFTHGTTLSWLKDRIGAIADHVCISDGSAVRLIPGLRNHVYFYSLGNVAHLQALFRLEKRAPELLAQLRTQINTALRFRWKDNRFSPETLAVVADDQVQQEAPTIRRLVFNRHSVEDSVARTLRSAPVGWPVEPFDRLVYFRISESGLSDVRLARRLLAWVAQTLADDRSAIVWSLPERDGGGSEARFAAVLGSLFAGGGRLPGAVLGNVYCATAELDAKALDAAPARRTLVIDDFADVSLSPPSFYERFEAIQVYARPGRHMPVQFRELLRAVYGPDLRVEWLQERPGDPSEPHPA